MWAAVNEFRSKLLPAGNPNNYYIIYKYIPMKVTCFKSLNRNPEKSSINDKLENFIHLQSYVIPRNLHACQADFVRHVPD